jgi:hypothetical protein
MTPSRAGGPLGEAAQKTRVRAGVTIDSPGNRSKEALARTRMSLLAESVYWGSLTVHRAKVVIEQVDIATSDLQ